MRLFYDELSSRLKGEILLLLCDMAAMSSAVLFATGVMHRGSRPDDVALLVVWSCIPRALAKVVGQMERPSQGFRAFLGSAALIALTSVLLLAGWEIISTAAPQRSPIEPSTAALIFFAWGSGFLLFHTRAYRLHDFLLWSVVLLGLKDGRPFAFASLLVFWMAALLSASVRHLLHDAFRDAPHARVNIQNARVSALLAAAAAAVVFLGAYVVIHGGFDFPEPRRILADGRGDRNLSADFVEGNGSRSGRRPRARAAALQALKDVASANAERPGGRIGFTYRVALRDLSLARFDPREVLRVKAQGDGGEAWRPLPSTYWKAVSFSRFNVEDESWSEETDYVRMKWPADHRLARKLPAPLPASPPVTLELRVVTPVTRNIVMPYFTSSVRSDELSLYRESALGDVFPYPTPVRGTKYSADVVLAGPDFLPEGDSRGAHEDARYLELPAAGDAHIDLRSYASDVFTGKSDGVREMIQRLRAHFANGFKYSQNAVWKAGRKPLATFLLKEKTGNCTYFATAAALLLRAGGVSSRLAVGFLGSDWDEKAGEAVIKNGTAHAWVEVYFPGHGWYPVDATSWVPVDASFQPPQDALEEMREVLRGARAQTRDDAHVDAPTRTPRLPPSTSGDDGSDQPDRSIPDEDREVTDKLPEGTIEDAEGGGSWIEYGGELDPTKQKGPEESASDAPPDSASAPQGIATVPEVPRLADGSSSAVEELPDELASREGDETAKSARIRAALRLALAAAGLAVILLLVLAFLRKSPAEEDENRDGDENEARAEAAAAATASALASLDESEPRGRVIAEYHRLQQALERTRSHRRPHQTPLEHARSVATRQSEAEKAFFDLHRVLYRLLYGGETIDANQADIAVRSCKKLRKALG